MTRKLTVLSLAALASLAFAQRPGPGSPPMGTPRLEAIQAYLGLQDSQVTALQEVRQQEFEATRAAAQTVAQKEVSLREQLNAGSTDAAALGKLLIEIQALRKQVGTVHDNFRNQALNVLTPDQKTKLKGLEEAVKLQPAIQQAAALGLLAPPANVEGRPGFMPGVGDMPGRMGPMMPMRRQPGGNGVR